MNGKLLVILGIALANTILVFVLGLVFGLIYSTGYSFQDIVSHLYMLGIYFAQAVAHMLAALMIVVWLRNKTLAIVVLVIYQFIFEPLLRLVLNKYVLAKMGLFFPMRVITRLIPLPDLAITEMLKANSEFGQMAQKLPIGVNLLLVAGYSLAFYLITRMILLKRNL